VSELFIPLFFAFLHPITVGVNHEPIKALATTVNNVAIYSGGIGGGSSLKIAVKLQIL
jgi:hypothetical protein